MTFRPRGTDLWGLGDYDAPELRLNGLDDDGIRWGLGPVEGWNRTSVDAPILEGGGDGGWFTPGRRKPKPLTLTGAFVACDEDLLELAEKKLRTALERYTTDQVLWRAKGTSSPKQMTIRLTGDLDVDEVRGNPRGRIFSGVFTAADPYKYAAGSAGLITATTGLAANQAGSVGMTFPMQFPLDFGGVAAVAGQMTVWNTGTLPVYPVLSFRGLADQPQVRHLGLGVSSGLRRVLASGSVASLDHDTHAVLADGASIFGDRMIGETFFPLLPGRNDLRFLAATYSAEARATVTFRPRWS